MSGIDQRIVEMEFRGKSFASDVQSIIHALEALKNGLNNLRGADTDINKLDDAGKRFSLKGMEQGVDSMVGKFKTMSVVGVAALASIVNRAVGAGLSILKSFTIDPIKAGLDAYETKINAIQTILANTKSEGTTLGTVTAALNNLNKYANLTVYNFSQMARNIGTFTAAGVGLKTSVASIKGIANLAALSGSSAEQASTGMYQLSQAIAAGVVKLQDWNSVVNAGFGGKVFQNALIQTARVNGVAVDAMIKKYGSFRQSLQSGWLSAKILTETLSEFTGDLSAKQLRAMGFTEAETKAIMSQAKIALQSATQIRTVSQLTAALKDDVSTAWAGVWQAIIGDSKTAPKVLTAVFNTLSGVILSPIHGLTNLINEVDKLGGRDEIVEAVSNGFKNLGALLHVVGSAFKDVFPPVTAETIVKMAAALEKFTESLKLSSKGTQELKSVFVGIFSVIKILLDLVGAIAHGLGIMFGTAASGGESFLDLAVKVSNFITRIREAIEQGNIFTRIFSVIGRVLSYPIQGIIEIVKALGGLSGILDRVEKVAAPFVKKFGQEFAGLANAIADGIKNGNFAQVTSLINHVLFGTVLLSIRKFINNLTKGNETSGLLDTIKESFEGLTSALKSMQANLKAGTLEKIAISVGILAAALLVLSLVNVKQMGIALAAITIMMTQLIGAMAILVKVAGSKGIVKMAIIVAAMNLLATALVILSGAVAILAQFSWEQLAKGLSAIAILLGEIVISMALFSSDSKGIIVSAYSMQIMAVAMNILAVAVGRLGKMDIGTLAKGVGSIAILLAIIGGFNALGGEALIGTAVSMVIIAASLIVMAKAVAAFGSLSIGTLAKGLISITLALLIITAAMILMTEALPGALALVIVAASLVIMAKAFQSFGGMSWGSIAKAMVILAVSLTLITAAMILMTEALPGALALIVVAASLAILAPILVTLGGLSWSSILKGLVALAGVFLLITAAGVLLTPVIPTLLGLGLAVTLLGVGVLAAGAGMFLFGAGLTAIAIGVTASGAAILSFVKNLLSLIPVTLKEIGDGIVAFAVAIGDGAVAIANAFTKIFAAIFKQIITLTPLAEKAFESLADAFIKAVTTKQQPLSIAFLNMIVRLLADANKYQPKFVSAGITLIVGFINGVANRVQEVEQAAANLIVAFITGLSVGALRIEQAGVEAVLRFINGTANEIRSAGPELRAAASNLAAAIIDGLTGGIFSGDSSVISAIIKVAAGALNAAKQFLGINSPAKKFIPIGSAMSEGTAVGALSSMHKVNDSMETVGKSALKTLALTITRAQDVVSENMNLNPVITPVLDLTLAHKGFSQLNVMSKQQLIAARSISTVNSAAAAAAGMVAVTKGANVNFYQTNNSPKAISTTDIYRRTKNQISQAKGALAIANSSGNN